MNDKEKKEYLKELKRFSKELLSSREKSRQFLIDAGIHTKTGRLTKPYRSPASK
jgi:hypothetical protein